MNVVLPFLQALNPELSVVPIVLAQLSLQDCHEVGRGLAAAIQEVGADDVLVVASTDMSHYVPAEVARRLDAMALERVVALDPDGQVRHSITHRRISVTPVRIDVVRADAAGIDGRWADPADGDLPTSSLLEKLVLLRDL